MAPEAAELLVNALSLSARDRAKIAHELLLSLDDGADADAAGAWVAEIEQRASEARSGSIATEDWEAVKTRLTQRWRRR
jgi:putative addiction module component (TIGR02574 family)